MTSSLRLLTAVLAIAHASAAAAQPGTAGPAPKPYPQPQQSYPPPQQPYPPPQQPYPQPQQPYPQPQQPYPQPPYPPPPQPYPPPPYPPGTMPYPPPYAAPLVPLTPEERELLARGEISDGARVGGAWVNFFFGLGIGQLMQGRWTETGWIFTLGETASVVAITLGTLQAVECYGIEEDCHDLRGIAWASLGAVALLALRTWSVADALSGPLRHNQRVRELRARASFVPYVAPRDGGMAGGLALRF